MLSPVEIRNKEFATRFRGYDREEVDAFLDQVVAEFERLYSENQNLREQVSNLEFDLARYQNIETSLNQTLVIAQRTAEDIRHQAEKDAELILREARLQVVEILSSYEDVMKRASVFLAEVKGGLGAQLEMLAKSEERMQELSGLYYGHDVVSLKASLLKTSEAAGDHEVERAPEGEIRNLASDIGADLERFMESEQYDDQY